MIVNCSHVCIIYIKIYEKISSGGLEVSLSIFKSLNPLSSVRLIAQDHQWHRIYFLFIVTPIVGVCICFMFCCTLLYVHFSIAIILMGKRELVALLNVSSWCLVMVERLFLAVPRGCLPFVIVVFPDNTQSLFLMSLKEKINCVSFVDSRLC